MSTCSGCNIASGIVRDKPRTSTVHNKLEGFRTTSLRGLTEGMTRIGASPTTLHLADRLLAYESALDRTLQAKHSETCHVCEKLRHFFGRLIGPEAYRALVERALIAAKHEDQTLESVQVEADGSIRGLFGEATEANKILIAHLIEIMQVLIGDTVTLWILKDLWPDLPGPRIKAHEPI